MSTRHQSDVALKPVWLPALTIRLKLILNAAIPLGVFLAFAVWLHFQLSGMQAEAEHAVSQEVHEAFLAKDLQQHVIQVQQFLSDISATRAQDGLDDGFKLAQEHRDTFASNLDALKTSAESRADTDTSEALKSIRQTFDTYYQLGTTMAQVYVAQGPSAGNALMPEFDRAAQRLHEQLQTFTVKSTQRMDERMQGLESHSGRIRTIGIVLSLVMGGIVAGLSYVVYRSVIRPIQVVSDVAARIAQGDLRHQFLPKGQDEISNLLSAMSHMQDELRRLVTRVRDGIDEVEQTSQQISQSNADLADRTEQQASALDETASSMQTLGETVSRNAENAHEANDKAQHARQIATNSGELVHQVESTMKDINLSSSRVSDIIGVIDGIAFQTNLLALNAAVEAARAGENGRGFAVVAAEVRQLASRSSEAAREIKELIAGSMSQVERGTHLVEQAGKTMRDVVQAVEEVTELVDQISRASRDQSMGVQQAAESVSHMDQATQLNASLVEQTNACAQSLRQQAQSLVQAIHVFTLDGSPK